LKRCEECGGALERRVIPEYRDARLGLPGVVLVRAVTETVCRWCGCRVSLSIPNLAGAIAAAAVARVMHPLKLTGDELRALRKAGGWSAKDLANALGVRPETVSRWETAVDPIGPANEKLVRLAVGLQLAEQAHLVPFDSDTVIAMDLQSSRPATQHSEIRLELVRVRSDGHMGAWDEIRRAA
jgi:transcriptional regulator with XRE-family HTH domain